MTIASRHIALLVMLVCAAPLAAQTPASTSPRVVVDVGPPPAISALTAPLRVREVRGLRYENEVMDVRYPVVALEDATAAAELDLRIRAEVARVVQGGLGWSHGRCRATLATQELVSIMCDLVTASERGSPARPESWGITFALGPRGPRRVHLRAAFVQGARLDQAICAKSLRRMPTFDDGCFGAEIALAADHLVGRFRPSGTRGPMRTVNVPYAELAPLIRPDGPLAFAAGAAPAQPTVALLAATPRDPASSSTTCNVYGAPMGPLALGEAVLGLGRARIFKSAYDVGQGLFQFARVEGTALSEGDRNTLLSALGAPTAAPCRLPADLVLWRQTTLAAVPLFDAPGGNATGTLPAGEIVIAFDGVVEGYDSVALSQLPGLWRYVVGTSARGWAQVPAFRTVW